MKQAERALENIKPSNQWGIICTYRSALGIPIPMQIEGDTMPFD